MPVLCLPPALCLPYACHLPYPCPKPALTCLNPALGNPDEDGMEGSKWSLTALWRYLTAEIGEERVAKLQDDIKVRPAITPSITITPTIAMTPTQPNPAQPSRAQPTPTRTLP